MIFPGLSQIPLPMAIDEVYLSTTDEGRQPDGIPSYMDMRTSNPCSPTPFVAVSGAGLLSRQQPCAWMTPDMPDLEMRLMLLGSYLLGPDPRAD